MHLFFIDESGTLPPKEKVSEKDCFFTLGGFIVSEDHWFDISKDLITIKEKFKITGEIKWRFFANNKSEKSSLSHLNAQQKEELRTSLYEVITKYKSIKIICAVVDLKKIYELEYIKTINDVYWIAYKQMTERFQYYLQDLTKIVGQKINGIIICDHRMPKDDNEIKHLHKKLLDGEHTNYSFYKNLIEGVFMAPSHLSVGIQFADMVAGAVYRNFARNDERFYNLIKGSIRKSPEDKVEGYGIIHCPKK